MTRSDMPFSRPIEVSGLPPQGLDVTVEATAEECVAVARDLGIPAVRSLSGRYALRGREARVAVTGVVTANVVQACVVTLDDFDSDLEESVDVEFAADRLDPPAAMGGLGRDPPDPLVNGRIDLGVLTTEFLTLGLDPYPRKPGASFPAPPAEAADSPFQALARLRTPRARGS